MISRLRPLLYTLHFSFAVLLVAGCIAEKHDLHWTAFGLLFIAAVVGLIDVCLKHGLT